MFLEHWNVQDTIYFLLTACTGVGFGDMVPHTDAAKLFTAVYIPLGMVPVFRMALAYGRLIQSSVLPLTGGLLTQRPLRVTDIHDRSDLLAYSRALLAPLAVIGLGTFLAHRFLYFSMADAVYFSATTVTLVGFGDLTPSDMMREVFTGLFVLIGAGAFVAAVEEFYLTFTARQVASTDLRHFADELLLQESCWDSGWPDASASAARAEGAGSTVPQQYVFARPADGAGLSEAEFILAALTGHRVVDPSTLVALRKQFRALMQVAERHGGRDTDLPVAKGDSGLGTAASGHPRLDARALFAITKSTGMVRQRAADVAKGTRVEAVVQSGQVASQSPVALVDLTATDGGFGEWREFFWAARVKELRDKAAADFGEPTADQTSSQTTASGAAALL